MKWGCTIRASCVREFVREDGGQSLPVCIHFVCSQLLYILVGQYIFVKAATIKVPLSKPLPMYFVHCLFNSLHYVFYV
jgi:hypothetical protein